MLNASADFIDLPAHTEVMELPSRLDGDAALAVEEDGLLRIRAGFREVVLDCAGLTYLTGAGVQSLLRLARELQQRGGRLIACSLTQQAKDMFDACGLEAFIACYPDLPAAQEALAA